MEVIISSEGKVWETAVVGVTVADVHPRAVVNGFRGREAMQELCFGAESGFESRTQARLGQVEA
jgi:hypothetical protein